MTSSSSANIPRARVLGSFEKRERTSQGTSFTTTCHIEARVSAVIICGRRRILSPLKQLSLRANMANCRNGFMRGVAVGGYVRYMGRNRKSLIPG